MPRLLSAVETLEDPLPVGRPDRRTLIMYADDSLSEILLGADRDGRSGRGIPGRVIDELLECRRQYLTVAIDFQRRCALGHTHSSPIELFSMSRQGVFNQRQHGYALPPQSDIGGID